jgi:hypothetical protein
MTSSKSNPSLPVGEQPGAQAHFVGLSKFPSSQDSEHLQARQEQAKRRLRKIIEQLRE